MSEDYDTQRIECDGGTHCMASPHVHGCFSDTGDCDEPKEHVIATLSARVAALEQVAEAARDLYEAVEMDESVGICLSDRVPSLRLGAALAALDKQEPQT